MLAPEAPILLEEAASELLRRREARARLITFTTYTDATYMVDPVHELIADTLDRVVAGELKRVMIFAPPQHGKSRLVSVSLPAYWLGRRPSDPVLLSSYGASLAEDKSREARALVESEEYRRLFGNLGPMNVTPVETAADSRAVQKWSLARQRGFMLAVGVGGPITGRGGLLGLIDDPFENWATAQSKTIRRHVWDWYRTTFRTRIWEDGVIVLVCTRWHEDDLAGRILVDQADKWTVLRLPAMGETQGDRDRRNETVGLPPGLPDPLVRVGVYRQPGDPLSPSRFSGPALAELKDDVGPQGWEAEYMGSPVAPEGNMFKREWFKIVDAAPAQAQRVRYWDKAGTEGGGKRSAGVRMARAGHLYYVEDAVFGQWSSYQRNQVMKQVAELDDTMHGSVDIWTEQEPGSGGKESAEITVQTLAGHSVHVDHISGDKEVRARPFAAQCEAGNVLLVRGSWNKEYIDELCSFPTGTFSDLVDGSSGAFNKLTIGRKKTTTGRARVVRAESIFG